MYEIFFGVILISLQINLGELHGTIFIMQLHFFRDGQKFLNKIYYAC